MCKVTIGYDLGNYDTKTQNTTTPSSYKTYSILNKLDDECIYYNGVYYSPTEERNNQMLDKTENDYCLIMALFAIAKETLYQIKSKNPNITNQQIQEKLNEVTDFVLGFGLPVGHYSALGQKMANLYQQKMSPKLEFQFIKGNYTFNFSMKLDHCASFVQDFTAVAFNKTLEIPNTFSNYYIIGIGGGTLDIIPVKNSRPQIENCMSLALGTTVMYAEIIKTLQHETGENKDYSTIESILLGKPNIIAESIKKRIFELAQEYCTKAIDTMIHQGLKLKDYPCVFIGGGALMMKPFMENNPKIVKSEYVEDVRANAVYYAEFA